MPFLCPAPAPWTPQGGPASSPRARRQRALPAPRQQPAAPSRVPNQKGGPSLFETQSTKGRCCFFIVGLVVWWICLLLCFLVVVFCLFVWLLAGLLAGFLVSFLGSSRKSWGCSCIFIGFPTNPNFGRSKSNAFKNLRVLCVCVYLSFDHF